METLPAPSISFFGYILPFLAVLTIVVFFHELGHFLVARWNKVKVEAFSVGFGPELLGYTDRLGTRWKLSVIPLGGYVKFFGDADAASSPDFEHTHAMNEEERKYSFPHKSVGQRAAVVAAGPIANFILAIVIFAISFTFIGRFVSEPVVSDLVPGGAAQEAGFERGDVVVSINGEAIESFTDIPRIVAPNPGRELTVVVDRGGIEKTLVVTPQREERTDRFGNKSDIGMIGIINSPTEETSKVVYSGPVEAIGQATWETWFIVRTTMVYLKDIVIGHQSADQLGGPIRIAKVSGEVATVGAAALMNLVAVLSVSIGLLNLFPIPMLDGGHLVFYAIEAVRGKPLTEKAQEFGFRIGLSLVLMLMVFATWNDISRILQ
ncbi:RIP metalloprotease RseP [Salaquimonas pukyongi]|uniref:RIP metalloprotease RseP n=1 Tax=Salaquimonas pukyongi TaxID=2712698 RepID=UPI00096BB0B2|nr:RIP metalloprotease RseP [Salaquimonas pukyongi]